MSRIGRKTISVPAGVKVQINAATRVIDFQGPKGKLSMTHRPEVKVTYNDADKSIVCEVPKIKSKLETTTRIGAPRVP